ncbi:15806_t:CDS:2, partial [Entrophospora sp. SA101]
SLGEGDFWKTVKKKIIFAELVSYIRSLTQDSKHRGHCTWLCKCGDKWDSIYEPEAFKCTAIGYVENGIVNTNKNVKTNGHVEKCGNIKTKCNVTLLLSVRMERIVGAISVHVQKLGNDLNMQRNVKINGQIKTTGLYKCESEWDCRHKCQSERECQHDWQCQHEWKSAEFTRKKLREYLKKTPEELADFFKQPCKKCGNKSSISSFLLYKQQPKSLNEKPDLEIVCHLVWNNLYRVFGDWECDSIFSHRWGSAYTWILLQRFIEEVPGSDFYVVETCK